MKLSQSRRGFLLAVIAGTCLFPSVSHAANIIVGTGSDTSYLILESTNLGIRTYEVQYTYNASAPQDGFFLLTAVLASDSSLIADVGSPGGRYLSSMTLNSITEDYDGINYWAQWVSGGQSGYPAAAPIASGTWVFGSGMESPSRLIEPGSWDAFYFSDGMTEPSVAPIPETSSALLAILGSVVIFKRRRQH